MKKNAKTDKAKAVVKATTEYKPIYLTLNGNDWQTNSVYLTVAIHEASEYNVPLYVTSNSGGSTKPPNCPPGFPNC